MSKNHFVGSFGAVLSALLLFAGPLGAQEREVFFTPMISHIDGDTSRGYGSDYGLTLALGTPISDRWNVEGHLQSFDPSGPAAQRRRAFGLDFQYMIDDEGRITPYLFFGLGSVQAKLDAGGNSDTDLSTSIGVGFLADVFNSERTALRAEFRHRSDRAFSRGDDSILSVGLQFAFGRIAAATAAPLDDDGDGVVNTADRCPGTPHRARSSIPRAARSSSTVMVTVCPMTATLARTRWPAWQLTPTVASAMRTATASSIGWIDAQAREPVQPSIRLVARSARRFSCRV